MDAATRTEFEELFAASDSITVDPRALERKFTIPSATARSSASSAMPSRRGSWAGTVSGALRTGGKTIVFAVTKRHAETLAEMLDEHFADLKPHPTTRYADFVVSDVGGGPAPDAGAIIKRFKEEAFPQILVSVNMLDTGFDCPRSSIW